MAALLLTGGRVVDPANRLDAKTDVLISEGKIIAVGADAAKQAPRDAERMALNGLVVCPGLIDLHVHLREPGQTRQGNPRHRHRRRRARRIHFGRLHAEHVAGD